MSTHKTNKLFITGDSGSGKSTMIHRAFVAAGVYPRGFRTIRVYDGRGYVVAYDVMDLRFPERAVRFMTRLQDGSFKRDFPLLSRTALSALEALEPSDVVLMDEIGGQELLDPAFSERVHQLLESPVPCVVVLKDRSGVERQIQLTSLTTDEYKNAYEAFRKRLSNTSGLLVVTEENRETMFRKAVAFIKGVAETTRDSR